MKSQAQHVSYGKPVLFSDIYSEHLPVVGFQQVLITRKTIYGKRFVMPREECMLLKK
jgi:hypothetical protein